MDSATVGGGADLVTVIVDSSDCDDSRVGLEKNLVSAASGGFVSSSKDGKPPGGEVIIARVRNYDREGTGWSIAPAIRDDANAIVSRTGCGFMKACAP